MSKPSETNEPRSGWPILGRYIAENRWAYIVAVVSIAGSSTLAAVIPRLVGRLADLFTSHQLDVAQARWLAFWVFLVGAVRVTLGWLGRYLTAQHGRIVTFRLREMLFEKWERLPPGYYHRHSTGELLSHALSDVDVVRQAAAMGINTAVNGVFMVGAAMWFMVFRMNARLALVGLLPMFGIPVLIRYFGPRIKARSAEFQAALGRMSQAVEETVGGIRTVKSFGNEPVELRRFGSHLEELVERKMRFVRLSAIFGALVPLASALGFVATIWYGGYLVIQHELSLGNLVGFLLYLTLLKQPLEQLGNMLNTLQRASASLTRLQTLLSAQPESVDEGPVFAGFAAKGAVEARNLAFRYPGTDRDVIQDLSFSVPAGGTLGIVGSIGSGKTTLAHLFLRLQEPPRGSLFLDGLDVRDLALLDLRKSIAYVPQTGFLFSTSIAANIGFSSDDGSSDPERVAQAARTGGIEDEIERFPSRYETEIGERGVRLSGGQKQRVAIARMVHKEAAVRILDDSLSAVDTETERKILGNFSREGSGATSIVVSHRLSAVKDAGEILVLDEGRVLERGNHSQLLSQDGLYAHLWALQAGEVGQSDTSPRGLDVEEGILEVLRTEDEEAVRSEVEEEA